MSKAKKIKQIFDFISISEKLKETKRWLHTEEMVNKETSADHSWHLALLTFIVASELDLDVDILKSLKMALIHDLVEAIVGDVDHTLILTGVMTEAKKYKQELGAIKQIKAKLPPKISREIYDLWLEYEESKTKEARFIKALDKIESISHMNNIGFECFDVPELVATYPKRKVSEYPEIKDLYFELLNRLRPEYEKKGWEMEEDLFNIG